MMVLQTKRLEIVEAILSDAPFIYELMNSPGWIQFIGDRGIKSLQDAENYIQKSLIDNYRKQGFGLYKMCLKDDLTAIGLCGFLTRDYLDAPDLGFAILPKYEGLGYTFEAAHSLMSSEREKLASDKLYAITTPNNVRSKNLLTRLGFNLSSTIHPNGTALDVFYRKIPVD
jgi:RimJ/RimL family protein N-acetyltransferase